jgi:hypothetical protein
MEMNVMDIKQKIEKANEEAVRRLTSGEPVLVDIAPAREVIPGMKDKMITHCYRKIRFPPGWCAPVSSLVKKN